MHISSELCMRNYQFTYMIADKMVFIAINGYGKLCLYHLLFDYEDAVILHHTMSTSCASNITDVNFDYICWKSVKLK